MYYNIAWHSLFNKTFDTMGKALPRFKSFYGGTFILGCLFVEGRRKMVLTRCHSLLSLLSLGNLEPSSGQVAQGIILMPWEGNVA
jgi:hypothetical protein